MVMPSDDNAQYDNERRALERSEFDRLSNNVWVGENTLGHTFSRFT